MARFSPSLPLRGLPWRAEAGRPQVVVGRSLTIDNAISNRKSQSAENKGQTMVIMHLTQIGHCLCEMHNHPDDFLIASVFGFYKVGS